jgi:glycerol uptake facilitator-like aquaporin
MKQRHIAALVAEALGVFVLTMVVLNVSRYGLPLFTAATAGVSIAMFISAVGYLSGGHYNPAVTLGLFSLRKVSFVRTIGYLVAQVLGAVAAWQLYEYLTERALTNTTTAFDWRIATAEAVGGVVFGLAIAAVVVRKVEGWQAAVTIGSALFLAITVAGLGSNGIVNPAVAVGVRSFDLNYFLGPVVGVIVGMNLFAYVLNPMDKKLKASAATASAPVKAAPAKKSSTKKKTTKKAKK